MNFLEILNQVNTEIEKEILPKIPIKEYKIKILNNNSNYLGWYKHFSVFNIPIIKLNQRGIEKEKAKTSLSLYDIILTTILHELAHAMQNLKNVFPNYDEEQAEDFAYTYWDWRIIETI